MIIDIHTHTFPDEIAETAISKLSLSSGIKPFVKGTINSLIESMKTNNIDYSVIMPIVTKPTQHNTINQTAIFINENYSSEGIISFGSIHPDNDDYKDIIRFLVRNNIKGIKLHPVFQGVYFDDIRYMRIIDFASEQGLTIMVHGGYDISFPDVDLVTTEHILPVVKELKPPKMIMAHMGAGKDWDHMAELLAQHSVMIDTSFTMTPHKFLSDEKFKKLIKLAGSNNVLMGSDSPWSMQGDSIEVIKNIGLAKEETSLILGENARLLLNL